MNFLSLFFPGVWVHEGAHALACVVSGVKIHHVEVQTKSGMVVHEAGNARSSFLIAFAPLIVGTILSVILFSAAKAAYTENIWLSVLSGWLALSIGFHSIPSYEDVANIPTAIARQFRALWSGNHSLIVRLVKGAWYAVCWPLSMVLSLVAWAVNLSILFRLVWVLGLGLIA